MSIYKYSEHIYKNRVGAAGWWQVAHKIMIISSFQIFIVIDNFIIGKGIAVAASQIKRQELAKKHPKNTKK